MAQMSKGGNVQTSLQVKERALRQFQKSLETVRGYISLSAYDRQRMTAKYLATASCWAVAPSKHWINKARKSDVQMTPDATGKFLQVLAELRGLPGDKASQLARDCAVAHLSIVRAEIVSAFDPLVEQWPDGEFAFDFAFRVKVGPEGEHDRNTDERARRALRTIFALMDVQPTEEHIEYSLEYFKRLCERARMSAAASHLPAGRFHIVSTCMWTGYPAVPTALITLQLPNGEIKSGEGTGEGIVDACCHAFIAIIGQRFTVRGFTIIIAEEDSDKGSAAKAKAQVVIEIAGKRFTGEGVDIDTLRAAAMAFVDGLNKAVEAAILRI